MSEGWNRVRGRSPPRANFRAVRPRAASREEPEIVMKNPDAFERILASLYDAMLDETRWPATSALIDEACGLTGNGLMVAEGPKNDVRGLFVGLYYRGQRREDLEREYLEHYHSIDERVPRFRQLPVRRLVHINDLYTAEELKTSPTYNEILLRAGMQDGLNVRLPGLDGSHIGWGLNDPVDSDGWEAPRITMVQRLLPHIQQFVRVRQALVRAEARSSTVTALLDNPRIGVLELDRRGRCQWVDGAPPLVRGAAVRGARQAGGRPSSGPRSAARGRAGADCRAGAPASHQSRPGGHDPGTDAGGDSGGGLVGGRQERRRHGRCDGAYESRHLLAPAADLPEALPLAAGGPGAVGAVARRARVRAARSAATLAK